MNTTATAPAAGENCCALAHDPVCLERKLTAKLTQPNVDWFDTKQTKASSVVVTYIGDVDEIVHSEVPLPMVKLPSRVMGEKQKRTPRTAPVFSCSNIGLHNRVVLQQDALFLQLLVLQEDARIAAVQENSTCTDNDDSNNNTAEQSTPCNPLLLVENECENHIDIEDAPPPESSSVSALEDPAQKEPIQEPLDLSGAILETGTVSLVKEIDNAGDKDKEGEVAPRSGDANESLIETFTNNIVEAEVQLQKDDAGEEEQGHSELAENLEALPHDASNGNDHELEDLLDALLDPTEGSAEADKPDTILSSAMDKADSVMSVIGKEISAVPESPVVTESPLIASELQKPTTNGTKKRRSTPVANKTPSVSAVVKELKPSPSKKMSTLYKSTPRRPTTVPVSPNLATASRPARAKPVVVSVRTPSRPLTVTIPNAPNFATTALLGEPKRPPPSPSVTLAQSTDVLRRALREEDKPLSHHAPMNDHLLGEPTPGPTSTSNTSSSQSHDVEKKTLSRRGKVTVPRGPHLATEERLGQKGGYQRATEWDDFTLAQSTERLQKELRNSTPRVEHEGADGRTPGSFAGQSTKRQTTVPRPFSFDHRPAGTKARESPPVVVEATKPAHFTFRARPMPNFGKAKIPMSRAERKGSGRNNNNYNNNNLPETPHSTKTV